MVKGRVRGGWWRDISPNLNVDALRKFLHNLERTTIVLLEEGSIDVLVWAWEGDHCFSARAAYMVVFGM